MRMSARILGQHIGLRAEEMNQLLKDQGFLSGVPGDYFITEKAAPYANYTYHDNYTGITYDDSIFDKLDISEECLHAARDAVSQRHRELRDNIMAERATMEEAFHAAHPDLLPNEHAEKELSIPINSEKGLSGLAVTGIVVGGIIVIGAISYGIYKAAPHIKKWWKEKVTPVFKKERQEAV